MYLEQKAGQPEPAREKPQSGSFEKCLVDNKKRKPAKAYFLLAGFRT
jgi:hypothetical protein